MVMRFCCPSPSPFLSSCLQSYINYYYYFFLSSCFFHLNLVKHEWNDESWWCPPLFLFFKEVFMFLVFFQDVSFFQKSLAFCSYMLDKTGTKDFIDCDWASDLTRYIRGSAWENCIFNFIITTKIPLILVEK